MHTVTIETIKWFWHRYCMQVMLSCNSFYDQFKSLNVIAGGNRIFIFKVDFMLTLCNFVWDASISKPMSSKFL